MCAFNVAWERYCHKSMNIFICKRLRGKDWHLTDFCRWIFNLHFQAWPLRLTCNHSYWSLLLIFFMLECFSLSVRVRNMGCIVPLTLKMADLLTLLYM